MIPSAPSSRRFVGTFVVLASLAGWAAAESRVDAAALDDIYAEQNIQRQLPIAAPRTTRSASGFGIPTAFAWGLLAAAVVGIAALALWLAGFGLDTAAITPGRSRGQTGVEPRREPERAIPADWLRVADDLARRGRFGEAIHLLLLGVLGTLRADVPTSRAATAREIARATVGPHRERLNALVRASELVHFGGRSATREQFEACRRYAAEVDRAIAPSHA